jgi:arginine deiminase
MLGCLTRFSRSLLHQTKSIQQVSVFDPPTDIVTHTPSRVECFPFHLDAIFCESPPNPEEAARTHQQLCRTISDASGARVWTVRDVLHQLSFPRLRDLVIQQSDCKFRIVPNSKADPALMHRNYFDRSLSRLSKEHLIDLLMLHPTITINVDTSSTGFSITEIPISPLSNLVFTRDQQIVSAEGVVIGRFETEQRRPESELMTVVWEELGIRPIAQMTSPCTLEGGDFFPLGPELALLGVGLRTNLHAAQALLENDAIGSKRVVIVEDVNDFSPQRLHLDTFFSPIDENVFLCLDKIAQDDDKFRRMAHVWVRDENKYVEEITMPFGKWMKRQGYTVIMTSLAQQKDYFTNNVTLGRDSSRKMRLFVTNPNVEKLLRNYGFDGKIFSMDFSAIRSMSGGVHSATQILRKPE